MWRGIARGTGYPHSTTTYCLHAQIVILPTSSFRLFPPPLTPSPPLSINLYPLLSYHQLITATKYPQAFHSCFPFFPLAKMPCYQLSLSALFLFLDFFDVFQKYTSHFSTLEFISTLRSFCRLSRVLYHPACLKRNQKLRSVM